jgi:uncharacterized protein YjbJ (UPF0337 family)
VLHVTIGHGGCFTGGAHLFQTETSMNKDHVKGTVKDIAGKVQEKAGELTGSEKQQLKGVKNQVEGKIQKGVGDVKDAFKDAADDPAKP